MLLHAGAVSEWTSLQDLLREHHEGEREARERDRKKRLARGAPPDEHTRWETVAEACGAAAEAAKAGSIIGVAEGLRLAHLALSRAPMPLEPFEDLEAAEGVEVRLRVASVVERDRLDAALACAETDAERREVAVEMVREYLYGVRGGGWDIHSMTPENADTLERVGLLTLLMLVGRHAQHLTAKKAARFGSWPQRTSASSSAPSVRPQSEDPAAVTAAPGTPAGSPDGSPASGTASTPPTGALDGTSSTSPTFSMAYSSALSAETTPDRAPWLP
jgi:hypothetical protein